GSGFFFARESLPCVHRGSGKVAGMADRLHRFLFSCCALALLSGCAALGVVSGLLGNEVVFTPAQLQRFLDDRFPREYDKLGGLVSLRLLNPRLSIPAGSR